MGVYFGTDGFRGIYGQTLSPSVAYRIGNSLARLGKNKKILLGRDTRQSGSLISLAVASGIISNGVDVVDIGIAPTPAIAFLTKKLGFDYGVVVSASHNPKEYNGIKIFDRDGYKISEKEELEIERNLLYPKEVENDSLGKYLCKPRLKRLYKKELSSFAGDLSGMKIAIDCANGASYKIAKSVFALSGATLVATNSTADGKKINLDCGALHPEAISSVVVKEGCDVGFAFDGDADRIIACDEKGEILDGDDILYLLSSKYPSDVVGTSMTNKGLEVALKKEGKNLLRADVGDKYVSVLMRKTGATLGGEPSGHIINSHLSSTGDGVLSALTIAGIIKQSGKPASQIAHCPKMPQVNLNIAVTDKWRLLSAPSLKEKTTQIEEEIADNGRVLVRASGTENKIRIMCEHNDPSKATFYASMLAEKIEELEKAEL